MLRFDDIGADEEFSALECIEKPNYFGRLLGPNISPLGKEMQEAGADIVFDTTDAGEMQRILAKAGAMIGGLKQHDIKYKMDRSDSFSRPFAGVNGAPGHRLCIRRYSAACAVSFNFARRGASSLA